MASNQKLTKLLAGRALTGSVQAEGLLTVTFADGSTMRVKAGPDAAAAGPPATDAAPTGTPTLGTPAPAPAPTAPAAAPAPGEKIKKVRQKGCELNLDLEDGTTWTIHTAEATSSVLIRDKAGKLEYAD